MFERYTETARRAMFFARYEAGQFGSSGIETEHLLLGILREDKALTNRFIRPHAAPDFLRERLDQEVSTGDVLSGQTDLPLSTESKQALFYGSEEADSLGSRHIGTDHILLGLMRVEGSKAARLLHECGLELAGVRGELRRTAHPGEIPPAVQYTHSSTITPMPQPPLTTVGGYVGQNPKNFPRPQLRKARDLRIIRVWVGSFIVGVALSGVTAFPLLHETEWMVRVAYSNNLGQHLPSLNAWIERVATALAAQSVRDPFLAYGTDWLAFGHLVIAILFVGLWRDPVRNRWLIDAGLFACAGLIVLAFTAGPIRGIPVFWRLVDSSFGIVGCIPLLFVRRKIDRLERRYVSPAINRPNPQR